MKQSCNVSQFQSNNLTPSFPKEPETINDRSVYPTSNNKSSEQPCDDAVLNDECFVHNGLLIIRLRFMMKHETVNKNILSLCSFLVCWSGGPAKHVAARLASQHHASIWAFSWKEYFTSKSSLNGGHILTPPLWILCDPLATQFSENERKIRTPKLR